MGLGTILEARKCLLLATGIHKAKAVKRDRTTSYIVLSCVGPPGERDTIAIIDEDAADFLSQRHYLYVEQLLDAFERNGECVCTGTAIGR